MRLATPGIAFLGLLLLLAAPASAELELALAGPSGTLQPQVDPGTATATVTVACTDVPPPLPGQEPVAVDVAFVDVPAGITVAGSSLLTLDTAACTDPSKHATATGPFSVQATSEAPGLTDLELQAEARLPAPSPAHPPLADRASMTVRVASYPLLSIQLETKVLEGSPGETIEYDIVIENRGNAATRVTPTLATAPREGFEVVLPEPLVVERGAKQVAIVRVTLPNEAGWNNDEAAVEVLWTASATAEPAQVSDQPLKTNVLARVRGTGDLGAQAPGVGPPLALALLGAALVGRARLK